MEPINEIKSVITPLNQKNVDTDQIISKEFLKESSAQDSANICFITGALMQKVIQMKTLY